MRIVIILLIVLTHIASAAEDKYEELTTKSGETYKAVTVQTVTPSELSIMHESGIASIKLADLPEELQEKYGYNSKKAEEHQKAEEEVRRAEQEAYTSVLAKRKQIAELKKKAAFKEFYVKQVLSDGILVNSVDTGVVGSSEGGLGLGGNAHTYRRKGTSVFYVVGFPNAASLVDGKLIEGMFSPDGNYSYEDIMGARRSVTKFVYTGPPQN